MTTIETTGSTTTAAGIAQSLALALGDGLGTGLAPLATGTGAPAIVPSDAPALRAVLTGASRTTVVVSVWQSSEGGPAPDPADLVPLLAPAFVNAGLGDDGEVDVLPAAEALADIDQTAGHVLLGRDGSALGCVVVQLPPTRATEAAAVRSEVPTQRTVNPVSAVGVVSGPRLELLRDVELAVTAELGRTRMSLRELLSLSPGTVVELDRAAGSPVDLLVNGTLLARGEVVVVDEEFGVRITELVNTENSAETPH